MLKKRTTKAFGKEIYLLGIRKDTNELVWLEEPSWNCGWYWGFGYLETYTNNTNPNRAKDISSHTHFDTTFFNDEDMGAYDKFREFFRETTLTDNEIWLLVDYMKTFYTLRDAARLLYHGNSWYTSRAFIETLKDDDLANKINHELLPALFEKIKEILS